MGIVVLRPRRGGKTDFTAEDAKDAEKRKGKEAHIPIWKPFFLFPIFLSLFSFASFAPSAVKLFSGAKFPVEGNPYTEATFVTRDNPLFFKRGPGMRSGGGGAIESSATSNPAGARPHLLSVMALNARKKLWKMEEPR